MPRVEAEQRVALLIDCENQSAPQASQILHEAARLGRVVQRTAYADWTKSQTSSWVKACKQHGIDQVQVNRTPSGKNTVDNYMSSAATRLAAGSDIDAICLVTSDSDFSGAATNIRSMGKDIFGIGTATGAYKAFADTCTRFIRLDKLSSKPSSEPRSKAAKTAPTAAGPKRKSKPATPVKAGASAKSAAKSAKEQAKPVPAAKKSNKPKSAPAPKEEPVPDWVPRVVELVRTLSQNGDCPSLHRLSQRMRKSTPPINKTSRSTSLTKMLESQPKWFRLKRTRSDKRVVGVCLTPAASKSG